MNTSLIKSLAAVILLLFISASVSFAGTVKRDSTMQKNHKHMDKMKMKNDSGMTMDTAKIKNDSTIREGVIDLKSIDKNKDGKVYQDMMDYNVISDKPGTCPLCGMTLKEVSLKKAKELLLKTGYKVKE